MSNSLILYLLNCGTYVYTPFPLTGTSLLNSLTGLLLVRILNLCTLFPLTGHPLTGCPDN